MTRGPRGFTLLELIVALAMAAVVALTLYTGMNAAFRARTSATNQLTAPRQAAIAMDLLERDLQSIPRPNGTLAQPFAGYGEGPLGSESAYVIFSGFSGDFPSNPPATEGMRQIEFKLHTDVTPHVLVRTVQRNLLAEQVNAPEEEVLARGVKSFLIRYYDGSTWVDRWDSTTVDNQLPLAMELNIELDAPSPTDQRKTYRATRIVTLPCGVAATSSSTSSGGTP
jgi:general secretion pathway protein J